MANVNGTVVLIKIDVDIEKKDGGSYKGWKLVYEDEKGEVKTIAKHMNSLKYAQPLKNGLESLKAGDAFTLEQEKEGDFWNPKSIYKSEGAVSKPTTPTHAPQGKTVASSSSTYSTVEERAQTQKYIVRQSSITAALKLLELRGEKKAGVDDVLDFAAYFEAYVMDYEPTALADSSKSSFDDMDDDIPF